MACINVCQNGNGMGLGPLGDPFVIHKRKFRFVMDLRFCTSRRVPGCFIKTASRPDLSIEETEINYLNGKTWIPGKAVWEPITVTYYDVSSNTHVELLGWIASIYDFTDPSCAHMNSNRISYTGTANLYLFDGCGNIMERWVFADMWPTSIKFGDLDMGSSDVCEIEMTMRYSNVSYTNYCVGGQPQRCPCSPCIVGGGGGGGGAGGGGGSTG